MKEVGQLGIFKRMTLSLFGMSSPEVGDHVHNLHITPYPELSKRTNFDLPIEIGVALKVSYVSV